MAFGFPWRITLGALTALIPFPLLAQNSDPKPLPFLQTLVAGEGDFSLKQGSWLGARFKDGPFYAALFNRPQGLAVSADGKELWVADRENHRVRVVHLSQDNLVETAAGSDQEGNLDGPLTQASFSMPSLLAALPGNRLALYDAGSNLFRLIDWNSSSVTTLGDGETRYQLSGGAVMDLVYCPQDGELYFTQPSLGLVEKLDPATGKITPVLKSNSILPHPRSLCLWKNGLALADQNQPGVFALSLKGGAPVSLAAGGVIAALAENGGRLYALQSSPSLPALVCLIPPEPKVLASPSRFHQENPGRSYANWLFQPADNTRYFLLADPREPNAFFVSSEWQNHILAWRDDTVPPDPPAPGFRCFGFSHAKGNAQRILLITDPAIDGPDAPEPSPAAPAASRPLALAQRLQLDLNLRASLDGAGPSYEVFSYASSPNPPAPAALAAFVKAYGIDQVWAVLSGSKDSGVAGAWRSLLGAFPPSFFHLFFLPGAGPFAPGDLINTRALWTGLAAKAPFTDLTGPWTALRVTYFPLGESGPPEHLTPDGRLLLASLLSRSWPSSPELRPIRQFADLAAGEGPSGFKDGSFTDALFAQPLGLALDDSNTHLFVADGANHRVRALDLEQDNQVETWAGTGLAGTQDGDFRQARFQEPRLLAWTPEGLVVYDAKAQALRLIAAADRQVSTLTPQPAGALNGVFNLVYCAAEKCLYLSRPEAGEIDRLSMDGLKWETVLRTDPNIPNPAALALDGDSLLVSDNTKAKVFRLKLPLSAPTGTPTPLPETPSWDCGQAAALAASNGEIYALTAGNGSLHWLRVTHPQNNLLPSIWDTNAEPLTQDSGIFLGGSLDASAVGLVADPREGSRFFAACPGLRQILSLRDYHFADLTPSLSTNSDGLTDYAYPNAKPPHTYRILLLGNSHLYWNVRGADRMESAAKQMELELNTEAALRRSPWSFQVLSECHADNDGYYIFHWPCRLTPALAKLYDVDMVIWGQTPTGDLGLRVFYEAALEADGLPSLGIDPTYILKPLKDRIPSGPLGDLFRRYYQEADGKAQIQNSDLLNPLLTNPQDRADEENLVGLSAALLKKELAATPTQEGKPVDLRIGFYPSGNFGCFYPQEPLRAFWADVAHNTALPFLDLTDPYMATRLSFFPVSEFDPNFHPTNGGFRLLAYLFDRELIRENAIPMDGPSPLKTETNNP